MVWVIGATVIFSAVMESAAERWWETYSAASLRGCVAGQSVNHDWSSAKREGRRVWAVEYCE